MKRTELERLKTAVRKGKELEDFSVDQHPSNRTGFLWVPIYNADSKSIGWQEVPDPDYVPTADGSYLHPFAYTVGMTVTVEKWYTDGDNVWECIKTGVPVDFSDAEFFDIVG